MGVDKYTCFMQMYVDYYCSLQNDGQRVLQNNLKGTARCKHGKLKPSKQQQMGILTAM